MVNVPSPTDFTVPTAAGGDPDGGSPECDALALMLGGDVVVVAAPATAPPNTARPRAAAAAVVTRTPRLRFRLPDGPLSVSDPMIRMSALSSCICLSLLLVAADNNEHEE
jgi:hypothetical protein